MTEEETTAASGGWSRLRVRLVLAGIGVLLLVGAPFWGPLILRQLSFFRVRKVEIIGARYVSVGEVVDRLHVDTTASIWDPTAPLAARLASHPQIRRVSVRRKLPGTLVVDVDENLPVALVATNEGVKAFDARGAALPIDLARTPIDAPILPRRDIGVLKFLGDLRAEAPALYDRVSEVRIVGADEVLIELDGMPIRAMRDLSTGRLAEIDPVTEDLTRRGLRAAEIDLRYRDQVIARLP
jgi:cell division protein FtsQ